MGKGEGKAEAVAELAAFMALCSYELGNKESTIAGKLVAVSFYQQDKGMVPLENPYLQDARRGIRRCRWRKGYGHG